VVLLKGVSGDKRCQGAAEKGCPTTPLSQPIKEGPWGGGLILTSFKKKTKSLHNSYKKSEWEVSIEKVSGEKMGLQWQEEIIQWARQPKLPCSKRKNKKKKTGEAA